MSSDFPCSEQALRAAAAGVAGPGNTRGMGGPGLWYRKWGAENHPLGFGGGGTSELLLILIL